MDHLKFAQLCNMSNLPKMHESQLKLSRQIDVNYCVPYIPPKMRHWLSFPGYTTLHVAAAKSDLNMVHELISRGADVLRQGTENGISPIHFVANEILPTDKFNTPELNDSEIKKLIRVLLSTHVATNSTLNPKCGDGLSHFHIACIVDHTEAIEFFLKAGEPVDQIVHSPTHVLNGYSPLHCSIKFSSANAIEILMAHGADIHLKDGAGKSSLHLLIERLMNVTDFMTMGERMSRSIYENKLEEIQIMIKQLCGTKIIGIDIFFTDDVGFTAFHVACMFKDKSIAEAFISKGADVNAFISNKAKFCPGWTPLHFAASSNVERFKLLVKNGANVNVKNAQGETPLDFCIMRYTPTVLSSILSTSEQFNNIVLSDGSTKLLDLLTAMNSKDSFAKFLENLSDANIKVAMNSPVWPGYSLLHFSVIMNEKTKHWVFFQGLHTIRLSDDEDSSENYNCTKSEEAVYLERIKMCLLQGCSVSMKNAEGLSPIQLAFKLKKNTALEILLSQCEEEAAEPNDLSHLHVACLTKKVDLVQQLLNKGSSVNGPTRQCIQWLKRPVHVWPYLIPSPTQISIRAHSTPLHIAVILEDVAMVEYLLQVGADVYAKDQLGRTPIHLSVEGKIFGREIARLLIGATESLENFSSNDGLSHLHVAAFADEHQVVAQLLRNGSLVDQAVEGDSPIAGETPLHLAVRSRSAGAVSSLIQGGANIHAARSAVKFSSPLQYAMDKYQHAVMTCIVVKLLAEGHGVGVLDDSGVTLLHLACALGSIFLARQLLEKGADPNAQIRDDDEYKGKWKGKRPLHTLVCEIASAAAVSVNIFELIELLLTYGADATMDDGESTPLLLIVDTINRKYYSFNPTDEAENALNMNRLLLAIGDVLLKNQKFYHVNPANCHGITHFHYACSRNDLEVIKKFLDHGVNVNERTSPFGTWNGAQTPLYFALQYRQKEAVFFLIENGADVTAQDVGLDTPLHVALYHFVDLELIDALLKRGADINARNSFLETPVDVIFKIRGILSFDLLKYFLNRGYKIDLFETGQFEYGIIAQIMDSANPDELQSIFQTLIEACNLKNAIKEGFNPICSLVSIPNPRRLTVEHYLEMIEKFMEMGCDIDWRRKEGKTALHDAVHFHNAHAVKSLLLLGADMQITNIRASFLLSINELEGSRAYINSEIEVVEMLADHVWKTKLVNLNVPEYINNSCRSFEKLFPLDNDREQRFQDELIKMENTYISESLSVRDFMSDLGAVASYPRMLAVPRQAVHEFFQNRTNLREKFPEYCGLLLVQYKKLLARLGLLELAREALVRLCEIELPYFCIETILRYLKNDELEILSRV